MPTPTRWPRWSHGPGWILALAIVAPCASASPQNEKPPASTARPGEPAVRIFHKARGFKIPFELGPADRARLREIQLWVSSDRGRTWEASERATPDRDSFPFRAPSDGEYWFAVRTMDTRGRLFPADEDDVVPRLKVVVDSTPPSLVLALKDRRGSIVRLRYEARDENLDLTKLHLQYQVEGAATWRSVPIKGRVLAANEIGFDAATADLVRIRGSVLDRAGNSAIANLIVKEGLPSTRDLDDDPPGLDEPTEASAPPPITPIVRQANRPGPTPAYPRANPAPGPRPGEPPPLAETDDDLDRDPPSDDFGDAPPPDRTRTALAESQGNVPRLLVGSPRFPLKYSVADAGPGGPATVELWMTQDNGRNWAYLGQDPDRASPFQVDLPGDGVYGLRIVARSASGLGDRPPQSGEPPEVMVEVDTTPPFVRMGPAQLMPGNESAVKITWKAEDPHLGPKPVVISYRPDRPDGIWQQATPPLPNTGQYVWKLPPNLPGKIHLRIDVIDTLDNRGWAETADNAPVVIDRSRPKGKILGLDQGASGGGRIRY